MWLVVRQPDQAEGPPKLASYPQAWQATIINPASGRVEAIGACFSWAVEQVRGLLGQ